MTSWVTKLGISAGLLLQLVGACGTERDFGQGGVAGAGGAAGAAGSDSRAGATASAGKAGDLGQAGTSSAPDCKEGDTRFCRQDPAHAYLGNCADGKETCKDGAWSDCDVKPAAADACGAGDDADCDGSPNEGCPCVDGTSQPCGPEADVGVCKRGTQSCTNQAWGECEGAVFAGARDCTSSQDNDCDGVSDSAVDDVCRCTEGAKQACDSHPGDGKGPCKAGEQTCVVAGDKTSSDFGACTGAVGPAAKDTCEPQNDDDCDGLANEGCACVNGTTQPCSENKGVCKLGKQTCQNQKWGACDGVLPGKRDCTSSSDNDCNGTVDKQDSTCACSGASRACHEHPGKDGVGPCKAGSEACVVAADKQSSSWSGTCSGYVDPAAKDTCVAGNDADCSGVSGDSCTCAWGSVCGGGCCTKEPNKNYGCTSNTCAPTCIYPICATASAGCGGWEFDSNTVEGWVRSTSGSALYPGAPAGIAGTFIAADFNNVQNSKISFRITLCGGATRNLAGKTLKYAYYVKTTGEKPDVGWDDQLWLAPVYGNTSTPTGSLGEAPLLTNGNDANDKAITPAYFTFPAGATSVSVIDLVFNHAVTGSGTIYVDWVIIE